MKDGMRPTLEGVGNEEVATQEKDQPTVSEQSEVAAIQNGDRVGHHRNEDPDLIPAWLDLYQSCEQKFVSEIGGIMDHESRFLRQREFENKNTSPCEKLHHPPLLLSDHCR
jgi:hypothetical protein